MDAYLVAHFGGVRHVADREPLALATVQAREDVRGHVVFKQRLELGEIVREAGRDGRCCIEHELLCGRERAGSGRRSRRRTVCCAPFLMATLRKRVWLASACANAETRLLSARMPLAADMLRLGLGDERRRARGQPRRACRLTGPLPPRRPFALSPTMLGLSLNRARLVAGRRSWRALSTAAELPVPNKSKVWESADDAVKDVKDGDIVLSGGAPRVSLVTGHPQVLNAFRS